MNRREPPEPLSDRTELTNSGEVAMPSGLAGSSAAGPSARPPHFSSRSSNRPARSVDLHIEEFVLHGFASDDRYLIGDAVERELTRLFTEQGSPISIVRDGDTANVDGGALQIGAQSSADEIGARIARAIYGGLGQ